MFPLTRTLAATALLCVTLVAPALAASSASSVSSEAISTSVGSASASIKQSSNSSSKDDKVAAGEYRIVEVAAADGPGQLRLHLQHVAIAGDAGALTLTLPQAAYDQGGLGAGQLVAARHRPYGLEFARADSREAFFLVLDDAWYRELGTHPVTL